FIDPRTVDNRQAWITDDIDQPVALKGFDNETLTVQKVEATAKVITDILGYELQQQEDSRYRFAPDANARANRTDVIVDTSASRGHSAAGTSHHIAFRVKDDEVLMAFREKILSAGFHITPKIDRDYFFSLYFREPGGVLF